MWHFFSFLIKKYLYMISFKGIGFYLFIDNRFLNKKVDTLISPSSSLLYSHYWKFLVTASFLLIKYNSEGGWWRLLKKNGNAIFVILKDMSALKILSFYNFTLFFGLRLASLGRIRVHYLSCSKKWGMVYNIMPFFFKSIAAKIGVLFRKYKDFDGNLYVYYTD